MGSLILEHSLVLGDLLWFREKCLRNVSVAGFWELLTKRVNLSTCSPEFITFNKPRLIICYGTYYGYILRVWGNFYEYELGASIWAFSAYGSAVNAVWLCVAVLLQQTDLLFLFGLMSRDSILIWSYKRIRVVVTQGECIRVFAFHFLAVEITLPFWRKVIE
jgi:hypothetical protein